MLSTINALCHRAESSVRHRRNRERRNERHARKETRKNVGVRSKRPRAINVDENGLLLLSRSKNYFRYRNNNGMSRVCANGNRIAPNPSRVYFSRTPTVAFSQRNVTGSGRVVKPDGSRALFYPTPERARREPLPKTGVVSARSQIARLNQSVNVPIGRNRTAFWPPSTRPVPNVGRLFAKRKFPVGMSSGSICVFAIDPKSVVVIRSD